MESKSGLSASIVVLLSKFKTLISIPSTACVKVVNAPCTAVKPTTKLPTSLWIVATVPVNNVKPAVLLLTPCLFDITLSIISV